MTRALVVEDTVQLHKFYKDGLDGIVDQIDIAADYQSALTFLNSNAYDLYFIDGNFPDSPGKETELNGPKLAKEIAEKEGSYDKVRMVSANPDVIKQAFEGVPDVKIYAKEDMWEMFDEVRKELNP